jgi:hypothetical protein
MRPSLLFVIQAYGKIIYFGVEQTSIANLPIGKPLVCGEDYCSSRVKGTLLSKLLNFIKLSYGFKGRRHPALRIKVVLGLGGQN